MVSNRVEYTSCLGDGKHSVTSRFRDGKQESQGNDFNPFQYGKYHRI